MIRRPPRSTQSRSSAASDVYKRTGFDCSGLVLYVYAQVGVQLSHGATDQQRASKPVPLNALQAGDLVFYGNASYSYHVAIYAGGGQTIEAARTGTLVRYLSLIHISEPTRLGMISYAVFCLKKK